MNDMDDQCWVLTIKGRRLITINPIQKPLVVGLVYMITLLVISFVGAPYS